MDQKILLGIGVIALLVGIGIMFFVSSPKTESNSANEAIAAEALRLEGISFDRNLTHADFEQLEFLSKDNEVALDEVGEAEWMVDHNFGHHASHSLNAVIAIATKGEYICPADSLSHVHVFLDYNEMERAHDAIEEGKESLPVWVANARALHKKNPDAYPGLEQLINEMNATVSTFEAGDFNAAATHATYLENNGFC